LVAAVANLNLAVAVAIVAMLDIGKHFDSSQTALDVVAVARMFGVAVRRAGGPLWAEADGGRRDDRGDPIFTCSQRSRRATRC